MTTHKPAASALTPATPGIRLDSVQIRDPFILSDAAGSTYWLYDRTDNNIWSGPGTGFDAYLSANLVAGCWQPDLSFNASDPQCSKPMRTSVP